MSFESRAHFGRGLKSEEANKNPQKLFPFVKLAEETEINPSSAGAN